MFFTVQLFSKTQQSKLSMIHRVWIVWIWQNMPRVLSLNCLCQKPTNQESATEARSHCKNTGDQYRKGIDKSVWSDVLRSNTCILEVGRLGRHIKVKKVSLSQPFSFEGPPNRIVTPFFIPAKDQDKGRFWMCEYHPVTYNLWSS